MKIIIHVVYIFMKNGIQIILQRLCPVYFRYFISESKREHFWN